MRDQVIEQQIISRIKTHFNNEEYFNLWMSTPSKEFRNRTPYDMLILGEYELFSRMIGSYENSKFSN
jgi:hypothetical protein